MDELLSDALDAVLAALAEGDHAAADAVAVMTPDELRAALGGDVQESTLTTKEVTVHRKDGVTFPAAAAGQ